MRIIKLIAGWIRGPAQTPSFELHGLEGRKILVDQATVEYLNSSAQLPTQAALDLLIDQVHAVRVFDDGCRGETLLGSNLLLEVDDPADLEALWHAIPPA